MKTIWVLMALSLTAALILIAHGNSRKNEATPIMSSEEPAFVVEQYCELSLNGDFEKIKPLIIDYPDEYWDAFDKANDLYRQSQGIPIPEKKVEQKPPNGIVLGRSVKPEGNKDFFSVMFKMTPELIQRDQAYIVEFVNVWIKEKQARVKIIMKSRVSEKYRAEMDFLLYKQNDGWKIFAEEYPPLFPVYGMPENYQPN